MKREDVLIHYLSKYLSNKQIKEIVYKFKDLNDLENAFNGDGSCNIYDKNGEIDLKIDKVLEGFFEKEDLITENEKVYFADMIRNGILYRTVWEEEYPERIKNLPDPPALLYYKGKIVDDNIPSVAIIGARECSDYGKRVTRDFATELASNGIQVISGLARGIDGIAHKCSLDVGGKTFGILGNGVDVEYPYENRDLYSKMIVNGGVISEFEPHAKPLKQHFPSRNRIIAGFADVVLVIEARRKSGTYITVTQALEQGKEVFAVPGRITDALSDSCNILIRDGCNLALSVNDILEYFNMNSVKYKGINVSSTNVVEQEILNILTKDPASYEYIMNQPYFIDKEDEIIESIINLQICGKIYKSGDRYCLNV